MDISSRAAIPSRGGGELRCSCPPSEWHILCSGGRHSSAPARGQLYSRRRAADELAKLSEPASSALTQARCARHSQERRERRTNPGPSRPWRATIRSDQPTLFEASAKIETDENSVSSMDEFVPLWRLLFRSDLYKSERNMCLCNMKAIRFTQRFNIGTQKHLDWTANIYFPEDDDNHNILNDLGFRILWLSSSSGKYIRSCLTVHTGLISV